MTVDETLADAVSALREVILAGEHYRVRAAAHLGLSVSESQAVSYLMARGQMGQTELAHALGFNTSSTTALVDRLERRGIAERRPDPRDRRRTDVQLSATGLQALADVRHWMVDAFRTIDPGELGRLTENLGALAAELRALALDPPADRRAGRVHIQG